jgi:hypothetical protein
VDGGQPRGSLGTQQRSLHLAAARHGALLSTLTTVPLLRWLAAERRAASWYREKRGQVVLCRHTHEVTATSRHRTNEDVLTDDSEIEAERGCVCVCVCV